MSAQRAEAPCRLPSGEGAKTLSAPALNDRALERRRQEQPVALRKIGFDGYNLEMLRGTGVATYARCLANLAKASGHKTGVLFSRPAFSGATPADAEVAFFDGFRPQTDALAWRKWSRLAPYAATPFGLKACLVPTTGLVDRRPLAPNFVESDWVFNCQDAFSRAQAAFFALGLKSTLSLPRPLDVFHWTYPLPIRAKGAANIYTVHDIVPIRLPFTTLDLKRNHMKLLRDLGRSADHIVTVSENSKRDLIRFLKIDESRVSNTYQAVDIPATVVERPEDEVANELDRTFGLEFRGYYLFYGALEPKKNLGRAVQAYLASGAERPLVIVSAKSWLSDSETRLLDQIMDDDRAEFMPKEAKRIRRYDYAPFRLLASLIRGARAVVFPSLYEGFGLPVLEAMTLGTPVISSTESSIPEIAGDACLLVDPYDVDAIAGAILELDVDDELCAELSARGLKRARLFSKDVYEKKIAEVYRAVS